MLRKRVIGVAVCLALFANVMAFGAAKLKDPVEIIKKAKARSLSLDSYSYNCVKEGWDFEMEKTAQATNSVSGEAKGSVIAKKFAGDVKEVKTEPKYMKYDVDFKFKKPYLVQMFIKQSDYLPSVLQKSTMTFNPLKDENNFYVKAKYVPLGIKRGTDSVSGNYFYSTMHMNYMKIDNLMKNMKPVLAGIEKINGRDAYKIVFNFPKDKKIKPSPVNYDTWGVPKQVVWRFKDEIDEFSRGNISKVVYFFDVDTLDMVASDCLQANGEKYFHKEWRDFKVNNLKESDF
ncbi:MAG: hypothetical protein WCX65_03100 [bacterium]